MEASSSACYFVSIPSANMSTPSVPAIWMMSSTIAIVQLSEQSSSGRRFKFHT